VRKTLSVARNVLALLFRSGTAWGLIAFSVGLSALMFSFARGDGTLLGELQIRIRYALYFLSGFLNLILMYLACVSIRKDIEGRQFHMLAAAPVHRGQIWLGKYLGLVTLGFATLASGCAAIAVCAAAFSARWDGEGEKLQVRQEFLRAYYACRPASVPLDDRVEHEFRRLRAEGRVPDDTPEWEMKAELRQSIRRREQMLAPGDSRSWRFQWRPSRVRGQFLILETKFYAEQKHRLVRGIWTLDSPDRTGGWSVEFAGYPYQSHRIRIPLERVPRAGVLRLTFEGKDTPHLIFPRSSGVTLLYDRGSILVNAAVLLVVLGVHTAVLVALALCLASLFSFSVAVFVNMVIYAVGMGSGFFSSVVRDLQSDRHGLFAQLSTYLLQFGLWLTRGATPPAVADVFTEGRFIPVAELVRDWGAGVAVYTAAAIGLGIWFLTSKEIDRHLHT